MAKPVTALSTGRSWLDAMLRGGFPCGNLTLVYGEPSTGKTTLAMHCAIENILGGAKVLFIDGDQSFSLERLFQIAGVRAETIAENMVLFSPSCFEEQTALIENLENYITNRLQLVIVDSITSLYSASLESSESTFAQNRQLNRQLAYLAELAPKKALTILLTGHVHSRPVPHSRNELVSRRLLTYWSSVILRLSRMGNEGVNKAIFERYFNERYVSRTCLYRITGEGLIEVKGDGRVATNEWNSQ